MSIEAIKNLCYDKLEDNQDYISVEHFLSLQSRNLVILNSIVYLNGFLTQDKRLYIWFPTPPIKDELQNDYIKKSRKNLERLLKLDFLSIILDMRNNIGGTFFTFFDTLYPIMKFNKEKNILMFGKNINEEFSTIFYTDHKKINIKFQNGEISSKQLTKSKIFLEKFNKIEILINEKTMSSAEIITIVLKNNFDETIIYGTHTGGLTNGCSKRTFYHEESDGFVLIPIFTFAASSVDKNMIAFNEKKFDGLNIYLGKIHADYPIDNIINYIKN